jgi:hypothetical protein
MSVQILPGSDSPRRNGGARNCTTTQHKTHGTELEVRYPWHPWYGLKVTVDRSYTRQGVANVYAALERDGRLQLLEVPGWMFDPAVCASMRLSEHPYVPAKSLRALAALLTSAARAPGEDVIENQHLASSPKGDADAKRENIRPHATEPLSAAGGHPVLARSTPRGATESLAPPPSAPARGAQGSRSRSGKGGAR